MVCLFGHKWDGCKCEKCGKIRDEQHDWKGLVCSVCKQTRTIDEVTDHASLVEIAKNDSDIRVRIKAAEKLNDKPLIAYLNELRIVRKAIWSDDWDDYYAVTRLTDQALLADVAKNAIHILGRKFAVQKLTDQAALIDLAKNSGCVEVRVLAVEKVKDQAVLAEIIKSRAGIIESQRGEADTDEYVAVRAAAAHRLTDKTLIADVLENAEYFIPAYYYYTVLFDRLNDQS